MSSIFRRVEIGEERVVQPVQLAPPEESPEAELAALREAARAEGYAAGAQMARQEMQPALARARAALEDALVGLVQWQQQAEAQMADAAADLAVLIAARIIGEEISADPARVRDMVRSAMSAAGEAPVRVLVHPEDMALVAEVTGSWLGADPALVASPQVERGGCIVETASGDLDGRVSLRLLEIRAALDAARDAD